MHDYLLMNIGPYHAWELLYIAVVYVAAYFLVLKRIP